MKNTHIEKVNKSFDVQSSKFENATLNFTKEEFLQYTLNAIQPRKIDKFLEVASGTCVNGRTFAPHVQSVVCLDATLSMLEVGKDKAKKENLKNITFVQGYAENIPFADNTFDIVFSRLAFHHFENAQSAFSEMVRVLKPKGKFVIVDVEAPETGLRKVKDKIEILRDASHVRILSKEEIFNLYEQFKMRIEKYDTVEIDHSLKNWLNLTDTPKEIQAEIIARMTEEINGGQKTGFYPYERNGEIFFKHKWGLTVGIKFVDKE